jgi:hypothetical protein
MTPGALDRVIKRSRKRERETSARCELCGDTAADPHQHVLDERRREILCACRACALLFEQEGSGLSHYRLVPDRHVRLTGVSPADLGVPVGLAFFVREHGDHPDGNPCGNTAGNVDGNVVAHYPSPLGVTRWEVDPAAWTGAVERCPPLRTMRPLVEALLVCTVRELDEQWMVPIDECYRLVALIRREWTGMSGGQSVWLRIEEFFHELAEHHASARGGTK